MTSILLPLRSYSAFARHIALNVCGAVLLFSPAPLSFAAPLPISHPEKVEKVKTKDEKVKGSAKNTVTSLIFLDDGTIAIEAEQVGHLKHFGKFTGEFSYVAVLSPAAIVLVGDATLTNRKGEKLFLAASIVETGEDYPYTAIGTLTVTGGSGDYAGATGTITLSGEDKASLTDKFKLNGVLTTIK